MGDSILEVRLSSASRYHSFLAKHFDSKWIEVYADIESTTVYGVSEALVLLHPRWYQEIGLNSVSDPRGPSTFSGLKQKAKCRAKELWGYECPYVETEIHIDHTFPYSRGGFTQPENAMYLCREHNLSKSTDLHFIPWETFPGLNWIQFGVNAAIQSAQTRSKFDVYPLKSVLKRL